MFGSKGRNVKLTGKQKRYLRSLGHHLDAVVILGKNGVDLPQLEAIRLALLDHEIIKVRIGKGCALDPKLIIAQIEAETSATCVQKIGHVIMLYAPHPEEPKVVLPG